MVNSIAKSCANKMCNRKFDLKNPKKKYCCLHCKNQAAYNYKLENYAWEVELSKARLKNIQILEYLFNNDNTKIDVKLLKTMGFVAEATYLPYKSKSNEQLFRYGNLALIEKGKNDYLIVKTE